MHCYYLSWWSLYRYVDFSWSVPKVHLLTTGAYLLWTFVTFIQRFYNFLKILCLHPLGSEAHSRGPPVDARRLPVPQEHALPEGQGSGTLSCQAQFPGNWEFLHLPRSRSGEDLHRIGLLHWTQDAYRGCNVTVAIRGQSRLHSAAHLIIIYWVLTMCQSLCDMILVFREATFQ